MKNWIKSNLRNIIVTAFVIPILLVAFVSISHVTTFYGISNPLSWAIYLSIAIEIAALAALAAVSVRMGKFVYVPFFIVTLIQFVGNLYFSFTYIDENSNAFKEWMNMVGSFFEMMGVDPTDPIAHKRILALLSGGLLPIISLTFAHMLVVYSDKIEDSKVTTPNKEFTQEELDEIGRIAGKIEANTVETVEEQPKYENLDKIEDYLKKLDEVKFGNKKEEVVVDEKPVEEFKIEIPINEEDLIETETHITDDIDTNISDDTLFDLQNNVSVVEDKTEEDPKTDTVEIQPTPDMPSDDQLVIKRLVYTGRNG